MAKKRSNMSRIREITWERKKRADRMKVAKRAKPDSDLVSDWLIDHKITKCDSGSAGGILRATHMPGGRYVE